MNLDEPDILNEITRSAQNLIEDDLNRIVPKLLIFFSKKINYLAIRAYGQAAAGATIASLAFKEYSKIELHSALNTYIFKYQHWKANRDLNSYLLTCLNRLSDKIHCDRDSVKRVNVPVCPGCRHLGNREFLAIDGKLWKCEVCTQEASRLHDEILKLKQQSEKNCLDLIAFLEARIRLHKSFSLHSRKGYKCLDCEKFIPESINGPYGISCPYDDCMYVGKLSDLEAMFHPVGFARRDMISLQTPVSNSGDEKTAEIQDVFFAADNINADVIIEVRENFELEHKTLVQVLSEQVESINRTNVNSTIMQKNLMYQAYQNMLDKCPEEMVSYLVHRKQNSDFPIQVRIFQEYVRLMEDALPYEIIVNGNIYHIVSLTDPNIQLFSGISEFDAVVRNDSTIPNNTVETYVGGLKFKNYGPCFIGLLIDVIDKSNGVSLKDKVKNYSFVQIKMDSGVASGTEVIVKHFRIPSHYEMGSMVYLQRIRKKIVDSVYYRLHGQKRKI